mmetsp:Transcript_10195/g.22418  ORF Transcript_10195/g.22418 Transcript_10195/m.22418 type:complete len:339 (+) Transcript_10195:142-1158(+)
MCGTSTLVLSNASRYSALQRAFTTQLREWHWQRSRGTFYQIWSPPGVVFGSLKKDHYAHGRHSPPWERWGFHDVAAAPTHLVLGSLGGRWAIRQARSRPDERWIVADSDDTRVFRAFVRAMRAFFGVNVLEPESPFPNLRLLLANEREVASFVQVGSLHAVHIHFPAPARATRPVRADLITQAFVSKIGDAMMERADLHIVSEDESIVREANGMLTKSRLFAPCLAFPFHEESVPSNYPGLDLIKAGAAESGRSTEPLYYARWEKQCPQLPNFRFQGGKGYSDAAQGLLAQQVPEIKHGKMLRMAPWRRKQRLRLKELNARRQALLTGSVPHRDLIGP